MKNGSLDVKKFLNAIKKGLFEKKNSGIPGIVRACGCCIDSDIDNVEYVGLFKDNMEVYEMHYRCGAQPSYRYVKHKIKKIKNILGQSDFKITVI